MKRARIAWAVAESGLARRHLQSLSARGEIPGAAKLGGVWTYDVNRFRQWIRNREEEACRTTCTGAGRRGGCDIRETGRSYDDLYEQALS